MTTEQTIANLEKVRQRKLSLRRQRQDWKIRKEGQLKTLRYLFSFIAKNPDITVDELSQHLSEVERKETRELEIIEEDLKELKETQLINSR